MKKMLEIKNTVKKNNVYDRVIKRLAMAEESITELEDITIATSKTKNQRENRVKKIKPTP